MSASLLHLADYIGYLFQRKGPHRIHSPFVFDFVTKVCHDKMKYGDYELLKKERRHLYSNRNLIETVDFGLKAGEKEFITYRVRVQELAKSRSLPEKYLFFMYRLVRYFQPLQMLEFGTSTGLSGLAMALANKNGKLLSMEGCASVASVAQGNFDRNKVENAEIIIGNFSNVLAPALEGLSGLDLVFFDGNHRPEALLDYVKYCLPFTNNQSIFVFDDIHSSASMKSAWTAVKNLDAVSLSIDLYRMGIVFFRTGIQKQHFVISM